MIPVLTTKQMLHLEHHAIHERGISAHMLMENAGRTAVQLLYHLHQEQRVDLARSDVIVLAGSGGNGGDAAVVARYLHQRGVRTELWAARKDSAKRQETVFHFDAARAEHVPMRCCAETMDAFKDRLKNLNENDVIVDGLLGTGLRQKPSDYSANLISHMNASRALRVSLDVPSGMDADNCVVPDSGKEIFIVQADYTVTFGWPKFGLCSYPGSMFAGELYVADIGLSNPLTIPEGPRLNMLDSSVMTRFFAPREPYMHKGLNGHLFVLGGSVGMMGAASLVVEAALQVGLGRCTVVLPEHCNDSVFVSRCPEATTMHYPANSPREARSLILGKTDGNSVLVIGPGMRLDEPTVLLVRDILENTSLPVVVDASGLRAMADRLDILVTRAHLGRPTIVTPHPGEAGTMLGVSARAIQADRMFSMRELIRRTESTVVLKGNRTIIGCPGKHGPDPNIAVVPTGNGAMGSGGMGDALAGMLGAMLCTDSPAYDTACAAAFWHGLAGDRLASQAPDGTVLRATDVIAELNHTKKDMRTDIRRSWPLYPLIPCFWQNPSEPPKTLLYPTC